MEGLEAVAVCLGGRVFCLDASVVEEVNDGLVTVV